MSSSNGLSTVSSNSLTQDKIKTEEDHTSLSSLSATHKDMADSATEPCIDTNAFQTAQENSLNSEAISGSDTNMLTSLRSFFENQAHSGDSEETSNFAQSDRLDSQAFLEHKRVYENLKAAGRNTETDDIDFLRAKNAEDERCDIQQSLQHNEDDLSQDTNQRLFCSEDEDPFHDDDDDDEDVELSTEDQGKEDSEGIEEHSEYEETPIMSEQDSTSVLKKLLKKKGGKRNGTNSKVTKHTGKKANKRRGSKKGKNASGGSMFDLLDLLPQNIVAQAQANQGAEAQPGFTTDLKAQALKELIASIPQEERDLHKKDRDQIDEATRYFAHKQAMKADGKGQWIHKGMNSSLHHYQLIGAGKMRRLERTKTRPFGGILADSMGLGKTLLTVMNIVDSILLSKVKGGPSARPTLVVAPASITKQWFDEIYKHANTKGIGNCMIYKSGSVSGIRDPVKTLQSYDIVITSYHELARSYPTGTCPPEIITSQAKEEWQEDFFQTHKGVLHQTKFYRVVLDEAQYIKNYKSKFSEAAWRLESKYRWALSGTPIQNRLEEFYPYFRFLRMESAESFHLWKKNYCKRGSEAALKRLNAQLSRIMIRRTHKDTLFGRPILQLPEITTTTVPVNFNAIERAIYRIVKIRFVEKLKACCHQESNKQYRFIMILILRFRQLTGHFLLIQKTMRELLEPQDLDKLWTLAENSDGEGLNEDCLRTIQGLRFVLCNTTIGSQNPTTHDPSSMVELDELCNGRLDEGWLASSFRRSLHRLCDAGQLDEVKHRWMCARCQNAAENPSVSICCHLYCTECLTNMHYEAANNQNEAANKDIALAICVVEGCGKQITRSEPLQPTSLVSGSESQSRRTPLRNRRSVSVDDEDFEWFNFKGPMIHSSKTKAATQQVKTWLDEDESAKIIIFFQFRALIQIFGRICEENGWKYETFHGNMSVDARDKAKDSFTTDAAQKLLLMSLHAGGVGLNLTAANKVIVFDLWWNASLESQAFCRAFRIGQKRPVEVVRFAVEGSIDTDIAQLQIHKTEEINMAMDLKSQGCFDTEALRKLFRLRADERESGDEDDDDCFTFPNDPYLKPYNTNSIEDNDVIMID